MSVPERAVGAVATVPNVITNTDVRRARTRRPTTLLRSLTAAVVGLVAVTFVSAATPTPAAGAEVEWFTGTVDEFYVVPDPLPPGEPGDLIRVQAVRETASDVTVRIMYHSNDVLDRDRAVTGTLTYPKAAAPEGGWPVLSTANGTVGMATQCAISRNAQSAPTWGLPVVAVASDYIGLGPVGERHPYLSRVSEGNSVIDAVRAARNLPEANAGTRWLSIGGSQGGHGSLSANELGAERAPELDLLGTVSLAPAAMFGNVYGGIDPFVVRVVSAMGFFGALTEHPEIAAEDYASPAAIAASAAIDTGCTPQITAAFLSVPFNGFWVNDPFTVEPARSILLANDVGHARVDSPVLLVQGTADTTVPVERTRDLFDRMCGAGQVVSYQEVEGADHGNVGGRSAAEIRAWINARLAGATAPDSCPETVVVPGVAEVVEGDTGSVTLRVPLNLTRPVSHRVSVLGMTGVVRDLDGQAAPGADYDAVAPSRVEFAPGQTEAHFLVTVHGDVEAEADELIVMAFGQVDGGRIGGLWGLGFGVVLDDD